MRRIRLREYEPRRGVELDPAERDALASSSAGLTVVPDPGSRSEYTVTAGSKVGLIRIEDLAVEIRPKMPIDRLLFLVSYSMDPKCKLAPEVDVAAADDLFESIVGVFVARVRQAFRRGLMQEYRTRDECTTAIRGRIRFDDQIRRRYAVPIPVEIRYDDFTEDSDRNRVIKAALHALGQLTLRHERSAAAVRSFDHVLERVQLTRYHPARLPAFRWNRLNEHYRPAVDLALRILRATSFEVRHGAIGGWSMLFDMNRVFEDFVTVALREALGLDRSTFPQNCKGHPLHLDRGRRIRLRPDLSWWTDGACRFVGDVKYKRIRYQGFLHPDVYQLLAYTIATGLDTGMLIYARGEEEQTEHVVRHAGDGDKRLLVRTLDLTMPPRELLGAIAGLAGEVRGLTPHGPAATDRL